MRKDPSFGEVDNNNEIQNFKDLGINNFVSENTDNRKVQDHRKLQLSFINNRIKKRSSIMKKKLSPSPPNCIQNSKK